MERYISELENILDDAKDTLENVKHNWDASLKDLKRAEAVLDSAMSVTTPLGTIRIIHSGNLRHIQMIEEFLEKVKREA